MTCIAIRETGTSSRRAALRALRRLVHLIALGTAVSACSGSPTTPTAPPVPDPPKIACPSPAPVTSPTGQAAPVSFAAPTTIGGTAPVTISCAPPSGALFPIGSTTVTCTAVDAQQRTDACTFVVTVAAPPKLAVTRFLAFGDSITWGEDGSVGPTSAPNGSRPRPAVRVPQPYPALLRQSLASRYTLQAPTVDNQGAPGEAVTDPTAFTRFAGLVRSGAYDVVLIMDGANDLLGARDSQIEPLVIASLRQMIDEAKRRGVRPYLATIPPEQDGCCPNRGISWRQVPELDDQIRGLAAVEGIPLVDVYAALAGDIAADIGPDGLHPTPAGYVQIARAFFDSVRATLEQSATPTASPFERRSPRLPFVARPTSGAAPGRGGRTY